MMLTADISPPNSLLLIMDRSVGRIPASLEGSVIAFTSTCVAIGTLSQLDGSTHVILDDSSMHQPRGAPTFDRVLDTPGQELSVSTVLGVVVLEINVASKRTRIRIWTNDQVEPNEVHILASAYGEQPREEGDDHR